MNSLIDSVEFTAREKEVLELLNIPLTIKEISKKLDVSIYTIKTHVRNLHIKTQTHTLLQLVTFYHNYMMRKGYSHL